LAKPEPCQALALLPSKWKWIKFKKNARVLLKQRVLPELHELAYVESGKYDSVHRVMRRPVMLGLARSS